ncbi:hypothetical protein V866_006532 [Kwoniella sp. B9012]
MIFLPLNLIVYCILSISPRVLGFSQVPYTPYPSNTSLDSDLFNPKATDDISIPNPEHVQFIGCISFGGFQELLQENGVQGVYLPSRDGCITLCRVDQPFGLAYFSEHAKSCYCAPKEQHPMIEWVVGGVDDEGNCGGWDDVSIDYLNIPWIFHGCYTSLWSTPYRSEVVSDPIECVNSCQTWDGSVAMIPRVEGDGWLCACYEEPTEGVIGRQCGLGIWQGYFRKMKYVS